MEHLKKKLSKHKVSQVMEFVESQETQRLNSLIGEGGEHRSSDQSYGSIKSMMMAKHKTEIMREMLTTSNLVDIAEISIHSSDASDIISDKDKKLGALEEQIGI